jgi:hypothetical protein
MNAQVEFVGLICVPLIEDLFHRAARPGNFAALTSIQVSLANQPDAAPFHPLLDPMVHFLRHARILLDA